MNANRTCGARRIGLLLAAPGTSSAEAAESLRQVGRAAAARFPPLEPRWAYTSRGVRRKLAQQGRPAPDPEAALAAMRREGFARVAVLSLHLAEGMEYGELAATVDAYRRGAQAFEALALGAPLSACPADLRRVYGILLADLSPPPAADEGVVLVAHGSRDARGRDAFAAMAARCREAAAGLHMGCMLGEPTLADTLDACRAAGYRRVRLLPFMVAAGQASRDEVAGAAESSWRAAFERAGFGCDPEMRGLAEHPGIVELWLRQVGELLAEVRKEKP